MNYMKDIHVLNEYRFNCKYLFSEFTQGALDGAQEFINRSQNIFHGYKVVYWGKGDAEKPINFEYTDAELMRFPVRLEKEPGLIDLAYQRIKKGKNPKVVKKKKTTEGSPSKEDKLKLSKMMTTVKDVSKAALRRQNARVIVGSSDSDAADSESGGSDAIVDLFQIEEVYEKCGVHMFEFNKVTNSDLVSPKDLLNSLKNGADAASDKFDHSPFIDVERTIAQMKLDAGRIMKINHADEPKKQKVWNAKGIMEMNMYREMVIYAIIEMKKEREMKNRARGLLNSVIKTVSSKDNTPQLETIKTPIEKSE